MFIFARLTISCFGYVQFSQGKETIVTETVPPQGDEMPEPQGPDEVPQPQTPDEVPPQSPGEEGFQKEEVTPGLHMPNVQQGGSSDDSGEGGGPALT